MRSLSRPSGFPSGICSALALVVACAAGCGAMRSGRRGAQPDGVGIHTDAYPTVMADPSTLGPDFVVEQEVTMRHERGEHRFRAFLQKEGDTLTLIGLAPHGGRAFVLTQRGPGTADISFESAMPEELPFPPEFMLHDIHRTWFMTGSGEAHGESRTEQSEAGRVVERRFRRLDGQPAGDIRVLYEGGLAAGAPAAARPPEIVTLHNGWFGYRATVRTLSWQRL